MSLIDPKADERRIGPEVAQVPIVFSNGSRDGCSDPERLCDAVGTPFSSCSMALYGVSWVWGGMVANRSRPKRSTACYRIGAIAHSLSWQCSARELVSASLPVQRSLGSALLGSSSRPPCRFSAPLAVLCSGARLGLLAGSALPWQCSAREPVSASLPVQRSLGSALLGSPSRPPCRFSAPLAVLCSGARLGLLAGSALPWQCSAREPVSASLPVQRSLGSALLGSPS